MSRERMTEARPPGDSLFNPWALAAAGVGATVVAMGLGFVPGTAGVVLRLVLIVAGLVVAGGAVWLRLHGADDDAGERARSATLVALAALAPLVAFAALDPAWDSVRLLAGVLTAVAVAGAVLVLLPPLLRRVAVSLLVVIHFGGILTAVASVPPPGTDPPWVTSQLWTRFYRPYLLFTYNNNAYHFYSPNPGPPTLLWFYVEYSDGSGRWVELPKREQFATRQEYQRRLALTESVNQMMPVPMIPPELEQRRKLAATLPGGIPLNPYRPEIDQFRVPNQWSKLMLAAYARHAARAYPSETNPSATVVGVKVYRVVHDMVNPGQMAQGVSPLDPTFYDAYYQGDFDPEGNLKDPNDPYLYWMIPIIRVPKPGVAAEQQHGFLAPHPFNPDDYDIVDYTKVHAKLETRAAGR